MSNTPEVQAVAQEPEIQIKNIYFKGSYPTAISLPAKSMELPPEEQIKLCGEVAHHILSNHDQTSLTPKYDFSTFNSAANLSNVPFLIALPFNRKVRIVYGVGTGQTITNGFLPSSIHSNIMALSGDAIPGQTSPEVLTLPPTSLNLRKVNIPTKEIINAKLNSVTETSAKKFTYLCRNSDLHQNTKPIPLLVPIPAFLIYDGFSKDLDALDVFERVLTVEPRLANATSHSTQALFPLLNHFLLACLTKYNKDDNGVIINTECLLARLSTEAVEWQPQRIRSLYPSVLIQPATPQPTHPSNMSPDAFVAAVQAIVPSPTKTQTEIDDEDDKERYGLAESRSLQQKGMATQAMYHRHGYRPWNLRRRHLVFFSENKQHYLVVVCPFIQSDEQLFPCTLWIE